ncbi:hypothetical protein [Kytococcus aerolatus]|uniref:hypothetical protein n=1 Tax=Kytococcus aerolatus TaxID=592308 RepID=UPI000B5976FC|nr:hypothetical protein [Kytococcus aerolatus]
MSGSVTVLPRGACSQAATELPAAEGLKGWFDLAISRHVVCQIPTPQQEAFVRWQVEQLSGGGSRRVDTHLGPRTKDVTAETKRTTHRSGRSTMLRTWQQEVVGGALRITTTQTLTGQHSERLVQERSLATD